MDTRTESQKELEEKLGGLDVSEDTKKTIQDAIENTEASIENKFEEFDKDVKNVMGEVDEEKIDRLVDALRGQGQRESKPVDLSVLKGNKRLPDEEFDAYKARLKREYKIMKQYRKGKVVWDSMFEGPKRGSFRNKKIKQLS